MRIKRRTRAFSLVELVIVVVIIGVIAAIAVPRISRGAKGAADAALRGDLAAMRNAIDLYAAEHAGAFPLEAKFLEQLTTFTDDTGADVAVPDSSHIFGPYLRTIPPLPVAGEGATAGTKGSTKVSSTLATDVAWEYTVAIGGIKANTGTAEDESTTLYSDY